MLNGQIHTDYETLALEVDSYVAASAQGDYANCTAGLVGLMRDRFPALTQSGNPVVAGMARWDEPVLRYVIEQYAAFSNAAIHMFLEARIRNHWPALTAEIIHNIEEEMGELTGGVPHLELMRYGYRKELGVDTEASEASALTRDFSNRMFKLFRNRDNTFLAGVLLAFEATAVDEFHIVDVLLRRYRSLANSEIAPESLTGVYIAGHVSADVDSGSDDPEMMHFRGMETAIGADISRQNLDVMARGFFAVCLELNCWWEQLVQEALHQSVRDRLIYQATDTSETHQKILDAVGAMKRPAEIMKEHAPVA